MRVMKRRLALLQVATALAAGTATAFISKATPQLRIRRIPPTSYSSSSNVEPRSLPIVKSAKVLPVAYTSVSAGLFYRATKAVTKADAAVLLATATLSLCNLGPTDNARLASAKRADKMYPPCTPKSEHRKKAEKWRSLVRMKLVGQLAGLIWMTVAKSSVGIMRGGAVLMASNMLFFLLGAGGANHDTDGTAAPMSSKKSRGLLAIDTVLTVVALVASLSPSGSTQYALCAAVYAAGVGIGGLEGAAGLIANRTKK